MSSGTERSINRLMSIDILRCLAILLMVQVHFVNNLSSRKHRGRGFTMRRTYLGAGRHLCLRFWPD